MRQIGNAVPVLLAETLGKQLLNLLVTVKRSTHNHANDRQLRNRPVITNVASKLVEA